MSRLFAVIVASFLLASCTGGEHGPPTVRWGVDACSHCHMILGDQRFAAVARSAAGEEVRFDDLGCLLRWTAQSTESWTTWVHDARGDGWLTADTAVYTRDPGLATPMGSGLRAWASRAAAAAAGGAIASWGQLLANGSGSVKS